jgi:hypothetical protein
MSDNFNRPVDTANGYPVTAVAGHEPPALDDCVGATTLTVRGPGGDHELVGAGARNGDVIQFRERQLASAAADMPVWEIIADGDAGVSARRTD